MSPRSEPVADRLSLPYWEAARRHELALQRCRPCARFQHPPGPICRQCYGDDLEFAATRGRGTLYTFTVTYHEFLPGDADRLPLPIGLVELAEAPALRVLANLVHVEPDDIEVGMPVRVSFEQLPGGAVLPQFEPDPDPDLTPAPT
jgi:hypothetical protein